MGRLKNPLGAWAAAVCLFAGAVAAPAQTPVNPAVNPQGALLENRLRQLQQLEIDQRLRANPDVPPGQRLLIDYGGFASFNYFSIDDNVHNNHGLRQYELVAYTRINLDGAQELFLRGRADYDDYNPGDSFDGFGSRLINPDLDRGYYRFDLQKAQAAYGGGPGPLKLVVEAGRDLAYWANGLVLTEVLDGGRIDIGNDVVTLEGIVGITPTRTVDIDTSRPEYAQNTRRLFLGGMLSAKAGDHVPYVYFLQERDENNKDVATTGPITTHYEYNPAYLGAGSAGSISDKLRYGLEVVYEGGNGLSNSFVPTGGALNPVKQTRDAISAWAFDAKLDYFLQDLHESRYSAELIAASGDKDRLTSTNTFGGNAPHTRDTGFNGFGLLNSGLAFSPEVSNLVIFRIGASTFPIPENSVFRRMQVGLDFFVFAKAQSNAPISEPTSNTTYLGVEPDLYLNWQLASDLTLALRYGAFFPNREAFSNHDVRQFFYGGLTFAF